jgi:putative protein kinase ArgK-like GTPase of G3E family
VCLCSIEILSKKERDLNHVVTCVQVCSELKGVSALPNEIDKQRAAMKEHKALIEKDKRASTESILEWVSTRNNDTVATKLKIVMARDEIDDKTPEKKANAWFDFDD